MRRNPNMLDIGSGTIFRIVLILLGFWFLYIIRDILLLILAAIVISSAIEPLAKRLQRFHVPRALSVVVVYVLVLAIVGGAFALLLPPLAQQITQISQALPDVLATLQDRLGPLFVFDSGQVLQELQQGLGQFGSGLSNVSLNIFEQTRTVFSNIFLLIFMLIIALYLVIEEDALKKLLKILIPREHFPYAERVVDRMQKKLGRWVLAQLALGVIIGIVVGVGLALLGVPYALALGLLAGVLEVIPVIGPIIAGIVGVSVALSQSFLLAIGTLVFYVVVQQLENHLLIPNIMRKATGLNPLVTLLAVLIGGRLAGVAGIILSVPIATIISIFLSDFFISSAEEDLAG